MKYLFLILIFTSCATHKPEKVFKTKINKFEYLQDYYVQRDQLKVESNRCIDYTSKILSKLMKSVDLNITVSSFQPHLFDWSMRAKIHNHHLNYDFDESIYREYLDISTNLKECNNDFIVLDFLRSVAQHASNNNEFIPKARKLLKSYTQYISSSEMPILSVLVTASILGEFNKAGVLEFKDPILFKKTSKSINSLISIQSKGIKKFNALADYQKLYDIYKLIRKTKNSYKSFLVNSYLFK
jgi:hypothetical protein